MASQEAKMNMDGAVKELSAADLQKRAGLVKELINTEDNYVEDLKIIIEVSSTADLNYFTYLFVNYFRITFVLIRHNIMTSLSDILIY
jgi:hypothetical protein